MTERRQTLREKSAIQDIEPSGEIRDPREGRGTFAGLLEPAGAEVDGFGQLQRGKGRGRG